VDRFEDSVLEVVSSIPPGEWMTYGEVAADAGHPGAARAVGALLRRAELPLAWWRVVGAGGRLVAPDRADQERRLAAEGWIVRGGRIVARQTPAKAARSDATAEASAISSASALIQSAPASDRRST
jgi:methylated-DNA-protein-cysteine methyltransferase related protein